MCGRYHISEETATEIERLIMLAERNLSRELTAALKQIREMDIRPTEEAHVLLSSGGRLDCAWLRWGFPMGPDQGNGLVFNARCESAAEKPLFREGIRHRRIAIPAAGFYEWNREKVKYFFQTRNPLYMAGCCRPYGDGEHFVILTTDANSSMQPIHDRMPLLLDEAEVADWILDSSQTARLLQKTPPPLDCGTEYEQLRFF